MAIGIIKGIIIKEVVKVIGTEMDPKENGTKIVDETITIEEGHDLKNVVGVKIEEVRRKGNGMKRTGRDTRIGRR